MKNLLLVILLFLIYGCNSNSPKSGIAASNQCPDKPQGTLNPKNVEPISLDQTSISKSGNLSIGQQKGYTFDGKKGSKLSYRTKDEICVWVYAPDNTILNGDEIRVDGQHTIQVSPLKGSTSFTLEIGRGSLSAVPTNSASPEPSPSPSPVQSDSKDFDQTKAEQLVKTWLNSKSKIFAPPFDRSLVTSLTTGPLYEDLTKQNGPVDWLKSSGSYYSYASAGIDRVWKFSNTGTRPFLKVTITEDRTLYGATGKRDPNESGRSTKTWIYFFTQEDGVWKIHDYRQDS